MDPALTDRARVSGHERTLLSTGWQAAPANPGRVDPADGLDELAWIPAAVPGTVAGALRDAGLPIGDLDAQEWWFRTSFEATPLGPGEEVVLGLDGLATLAEVFLNGEQVLASESMFARHADRCRQPPGRPQRAGDPLPAAGPRARPPAIAPGALAHPPRRQQQPALVPLDADRADSRLRPGPTGGRALARRLARATHEAR